MNAGSLAGHILELTALTDAGAAPADQVASAFFRERRYLGARDRRTISEALFGIIRHRRFLEALLEEYVRRNPADAPLDSPRVRYLPLYLIYSLIHRDVASAPDEAPPTESLFPQDLESLWKSTFPAVDGAAFAHWVTDHAQLDFLDEPAPGGMAAQGDGERGLVRLAVEYSFQDWMVRRWQDQFGSETEHILCSLNEPSKVTLRVNLSKAGREECRLRLRDEGIETAPAEIAPAGLVAAKRFNVRASEAFKEGWYEVQDEGSQLISLIVNPQPGSLILDACAGAGGKSLHLADFLKGSGTIFAVDSDKKRLDELDLRARRAGAANIRVVTPERLVNERILCGLVLVDAPCSGTGTIRRNPGIKWRVTEHLVAQYAEKQKRLLESYHRFVAPGGALIYVTCSLFREENEDVAASFLAAHPEFRAGGFEPGICPARMITPGGFLKILPHHAGTDGFFAVRLLRAE